MTSRTEANGTNRLLHYLDLDEFGYEELDETQKGLAKREVADYLKNQVLRQVSDGQSPVSGEGRFRILNPEYARREKGGRRIADLELQGDLKDSLISEPSRGSFIKYGHEGSQVPKSDGHNQISNKAKNWAKESKHPKRRYIPDTGQKFDKSITDGIKRIMDDFRRSGPPSTEIRDSEDFLEGTVSVSSVTETPDSASVSTNDLFSDDIIEGLLEDAFERRGVF
jgi:hypothetical protein